MRPDCSIGRPDRAHEWGLRLMPRWMRWSLLALLSWGVWAIMAKLIGEALSGPHNQALSTFGVLPVLLALGVAKNSSTRDNRRQGIPCALVAGALACAGNVVYYGVLSRGGKAAMIVPLTALYPLVTILLAMLLLKERLNRIQTAGLLLSLIAIYLFNVQREEGFLSKSLVYALAPIVLWGVSGFLQKVSTNHISGELSTLWFLTAFIPVAVVILAREPLPAQIAPTVWLLAIAQGFFLALGNFAILAAFANQGKAAIITPLTALYPLVSVPVAIFFLGERISAREGSGIFLALVSVAALCCETQPRQPARTSPAAKTDTIA